MRASGWMDEYKWTKLVEMHKGLKNENFNAQ